MKNLKLSWVRSSTLELQSRDEVLLCLAFDIERNRLFFASSSNHIYSAQLPSPSSPKETAWRTSYPTMEDEFMDLELEPGDSITSMDYLMEKEALIVGTSNGHLLLHTGNENPTELVGHVEGGVKCISPSPDGDLLGIITGFGQILLMTPDWDLLYETALEDFPEDVDVSESICPPNFSFEGSISWRGDGKYFSTLSGVGTHSLQKKLKVWERDSGALHAASESRTFMGAALDWMPSGSKIAVVCDRKVGNKVPLVVFFERNGLERSSFDIVDEPIDSNIENLKWNCSSDLLAAIARCDSCDSIKIWFFSNNHWYLKQEIRYPKEDRVKFIWDSTKPLQLLCWTVDGKISTYSYVWVTAVTENSTALVIDGSNILVTPLSLHLMPPPMCLFNIKFPSAVCEIAFCYENSKSRLAAFLSNGCLSIVELPLHESLDELDGKVLSVEVCYSELGLGSLAHLTWLDPYVLLGVSRYGMTCGNRFSKVSSCKDGPTGCYLQEMELFCSENHVPGLAASSGWHAKISCQTSLEDLVIGVASSPTKTLSAFVQYDGGIFFEYSSKAGIAAVALHGPYFQECHDMGFSSSCPWMSVVSISDGGKLKPLFIGLNEIGQLQFGRTTLCNNCSSFSFYSNSDDHVMTHLILATKQDLLFIVDASDVFHGKLDVKYENFIHVSSKRREEDNGKFIYMWEKGAKIIGVLHGDEASIIIQTGRGNLESIYPRKLVLGSIFNALDQGRFSDAIIMVRRHRIDFNVIVDHCGWRAFLNAAPEFVKQLNNLSYLTEFVSSIKNENITETLYKNYVTLSCSREAKSACPVDYETNNKISSVLLAIRKALEEHVLESPAREICILTTLARSNPPALEKALERIKIIRQMELAGSKEPRSTSYPSAEEALKHLLWLSDSEAVYEAALGLYDLNLSAMVALNSQKDPKEFLPFLQDLERMPPVLMRYNIDLRLRRYESALKNLASAGNAFYADCMNLMKSNPQLFPLGVQIFTDPSIRKQVLEAWGDHLSDERCFEDAAMAYLCSSSLEKALKVYRACGHWSGVLTVAGLLKLRKEEVLQLAHELCEELQVLGRPGEAAKIALEYCGDITAGVSLLITARDWEEALRISFSNGREELISVVKTTSLECASLLISEYEEGLEKVGKYLARYLAVRQRRLLLAAKIKSEEQSMSDLDDDTVSETSSNFSGMSAYSSGTRKSSTSISSSTTGNKARERRRQRNKGKIRAGSPDEEVALVDHLKGMSLTIGAKTELKSLLTALLMLGEEEAARKLQRAGERFQLSQMAAARLTEDTVSNETMDEQVHTLENYVQKLRSEMPDTDALFWRSKVFVSP